jgi:shikimate kinase
MPRAVVSTGGGIVLEPANVAFMRAHGTAIYLAAPASVLRERLAQAGVVADRPSLTGEDPLKEIAAVLAIRDPLYREAAEHVVDAARPPLVVARDVAALLSKKM